MGDVIQTLSRLCPLTDFEDICILLLDNVWTNIGFLGQISVQGHELGHGLDRTLTGTGQTLYVTAIWTDLGQRFDGDLTNFGYFVQSLSNQPMGRSTRLSAGAFKALWVVRGEKLLPLASFFREILGSPLRYGSYPNSAAANFQLLSHLLCPWHALLRLSVILTMATTSQLHGTRKKGSSYNRLCRIYRTSL